jgi:hypothetical protein
MKAARTMTVVLALSVGIPVMAGPIATSSQAISSLLMGTPSPSRMVHITFVDGSNRTVNWDGVGCAATICSPTKIESQRHDEIAGDAIELDRLAEIRNVRGGDAELTFEDGMTSHVTVVPWNRVLYVHGDGGSTRIDLARMRRVEVLTR